MRDFKKLDAYLKRCIDQHLFPGAVVLVGNNRDDLFFEKYGYAEIEPNKRLMTLDSIFDLASLTKPIATATSILILKEENKLDLNNCLGRYFSELKSSPYQDITIFELLVHTSGIPAWYPLYLVSEELEKKIEFIGGLKPKFERNQGVEYSCLNYIILGELIRRVSGMSLNEFSRRRVFEPLSMKETFFLPPDRFKERFVTTEIGNGYEKETSAQYVQGVKVEWREYPIRGEVHDGNSFYGFGGVSGNAGLFSTARDIAKFIRSILTKKSVISDKSIDLMIENHTLHLDQGRGLGWAIASKFAGKNFSRKTFGHTGFTGVSLYADPQTELFVILLTNAVHPKVRRGILDQVRPEVCNLAYQEAISKSKSRR